MFEIKFDLELAGGLRGNSSYTEINGSNIRGAVELSSSFGAVNLRALTDKVDITAAYTEQDLMFQSKDAGYQFFIEADRSKVNSNLELEANKISNKITRYTAVYQKGQNPVNIRTSHKDVSVQVH